MQLLYQFDLLVEEGGEVGLGLEDLSLVEVLVDQPVEEPLQVAGLVLEELEHMGEVIDHIRTV